MTFEGTLAGLGLLSREIVHLISIGEKENISDIEKHFEQNDLVEYLNRKYYNEFTIRFDNTTYDNGQINKYFHYYTGIQSNECRNCGTTKEEDGLLLLLALISNKVEIESKNWSVGN